MSKLKLISRSHRNDVEIYQCSCCGKIQINIGPVALLLNKDAFFKISSLVQKALEEFDQLAKTNTYKKICFRLGPHAMLKLGFNELCDFGLCLVTTEKRLNALEKQAEFNQNIQSFSLN